MDKMSNRNTGGWGASATKELSIPSHVPVGAVIGRGGQNCSNIRQKHRVSCFVDGDARKVMLKGHPVGMKDAEDELAQLFRSFAIAKSSDNRIFEAVARDGPKYWWEFVKEKNISTDKQVRKYPYRLQQADQAEEATEAKSDGWIQEFNEEDMSSIMAFPTSAVSWTDLQKLQQHDHFVTRWSNVCDRTAPSIGALLEELEQQMDKDAVPKTTMLVNLTDRQGQSYDMKYHVVDGHWNLLNAHERRVVHGSYDVILDNDTSFRVRAATRKKMSDRDADYFHRHLILAVPENGDFFGTEVTLSRQAPVGLFIRSADPKVKVEVESKGLQFTIFYLDESRKEFRLECRLPSGDKQEGNAKGKKCQMLLKKVLAVLS